MAETIVRTLRVERFLKSEARHTVRDAGHGTLHSVLHLLRVNKNIYRDYDDRKAKRRVRFPVNRLEGLTSEASVGLAPGAPHRRIRSRRTASKPERHVESTTVRRCETPAETIRAAIR